MEDKELKQIVRRFAKGIIGGGSTKDKCFMVCWPLDGYLSMRGISCRLSQGEIHTDSIIYDHCWITLSDGRIIDPTADQFNDILGTKMPQVYLGAKPDYYAVLQASG